MSVKNARGMTAIWEILIETRTPERAARSMSEMLVACFFNERQIQKSKTVKKVSHISNVPKWANWINPTLVVARNAASNPVLSLRVNDNERGNPMEF